MLAEELDNISNEDEIEENDYKPSIEDGEINEIGESFNISDEFAEIFQGITEQTLATNENPQMN